MFDSNRIVDLIIKHWGWLGIVPCEVIDLNQFGNIIFVDHSDRYWRILPEELACKVIAESKDKFADLLASEEFQIDWGMEPLDQQARQKLGSLKLGYVYYLVVPSVLGGEYIASNIQMVPLEELISLSGEIAFQIHDLPDGAQIELSIVD